MLPLHLVLRGSAVQPRVILNSSNPLTSSQVLELQACVYFHLTFPYSTDLFLVNQPHPALVNF